MLIKIRQPQFTETRVHLGFSQRELGAKAGVSSPHICQIENGKRQASPSVAKSISQALGIPFGEIFEIVVERNCSGQGL